MLTIDTINCLPVTQSLGPTVSATTLAKQGITFVKAIVKDRVVICVVSHIKSRDDLIHRQEFESKG